jgi:hypothetical protein
MDKTFVSRDAADVEVLLRHSLETRRAAAAGGGGGGRRRRRAAAALLSWSRRRRWRQRWQHEAKPLDGFFTN